MGGETTGTSTRALLASCLGGTALLSICMAALTTSEGDKRVGYLDLAKVATACSGVTGAGVVVGRVYSAAQCSAMNEASLLTHAQGVKRYTPRLAGNQLIAATLLTYNIGIDGYGRSTVAARFNAGDLAGGCDAMLAWNKATVSGKLVVVPGLVARRQRERALCLQGLAKG